MRKKGNHIEIWKQRASLLLVLFLCMLISGVEYLPQQEMDRSQSKMELGQDPSDQTEQQTYLNVAVDAVVPFITVVGQQIFHLIFENIIFDNQNELGNDISLLFNLVYWEILLEQIISMNAP